METRPCKHQQSRQRSSFHKSTLPLPSAQQEAPIAVVAQSIFSAETTNPYPALEPFLSPRFQPVSEEGYTAKVQAIAQQNLTPQELELLSPMGTAAPQPLPHLETPILPTTPYESALENLRRHLYSLGNPYLVKTICEKLNLLTDELDLSGEESLMSPFQEASISYETKEYFRTLSSTAIARATNELSTLNKTYETIRREIKELNGNCAFIVIKCSRIIKNGIYLKSNSKIPGFCLLSDLNFKKLMKWIDLKASEQLLEEVTILVTTNALNREKAEEDLSFLRAEYNLDEDYNLDTLLSKVIDTRPERNKGLLVYWNHPKEFFINKTLYLNDPQGTTHTSTVVDCKLALENGHEKMTVYMQDRSELHLVKSPPLRLFLFKSNVHKLWTGIQNHSIE